MPFNIETDYDLNFFGNVVPATVMSIDGSILEMKVNRETTMFFWDSTRRTLIDKHHNEWLIRPTNASFENLVSCPSITSEELEHEVWVRIRGDEPSCMCLRCILNHVILLHSFARNPSVEDDMNNTLMRIYIMDSMIPTYIARIVNSFADGARNIVAQGLQQSLSDGSLESIIQALIDHMNDGPNDVMIKCSRRVWQMDLRGMPLSRKLCHLLHHVFIHMMHPFISVTHVPFAWRHLKTLLKRWVNQRWLSIVPTVTTVFVLVRQSVTQMQRKMKIVAKVFFA